MPNNLQAELAQPQLQKGASSTMLNNLQAGMGTVPATEDSTAAFPKMFMSRE
jgi:hypothetical protein